MYLHRILETPFLGTLTKRRVELDRRTASPVPFSIGFLSGSVPARVLLLASAIIFAGFPGTNFAPGRGAYATFVIVAGVGAAVVWRGVALERALRDRLVQVALALLLWALVSVSWSSTPSPANAVTVLVLAALAASLPYPAMADPAASTHARLDTLAVMAGLVSIASLVQGLLPLRRMSELRVPVRPPLSIGGASNSGVGLTLCLAILLAAAARPGRMRWLWVALAVITGLVAVQSLSRAGLALVAVLALVALEKHVGSHLLLRALALLMGLLGVLLLYLIRGASIFHDVGRLSSARGSWDAWTESPASLIFGRGSGELWPWLSFEHGSVPLIKDTYLQSTEWGELLYHPHSVFLGVAAELGLVGLALLALVLTELVSRCIGVIREGGELSLPAFALLLSIPAFAVEYYLFRGFPTALLWWAVAWSMPARARSMIGVRWRRPLPLRSRWRTD